jgi:hypothetical protein
MDENNNDERVEVTPAAPLSAEFIAGGTAAGLEKIRTRLLDITNRNRLLNFRHTISSSIRIVDADPNVIFTRLLNDEEIPLRPVPEPNLPSDMRDTDSPDDQNSAASKPLAADYAESHGWNTSYDLTRPSRHVQT